jgi:hypothetical protein
VPEELQEFINHLVQVQETSFAMEVESH